MSGSTDGAGFWSATAARWSRVLTARRSESGRVLTRAEEAKLARSVWWDAGAVKADAVRTSFCRLMRAVGRPDSTCPKS